MKFVGQKMAGGDPLLVYNFSLLLIFGLSFAVSGSADAELLYKYRGDNDEWIYTDRPPADGKVSEVRDLVSPRSKAEVVITSQRVGRSVQLTATNQFFAPVELALNIDELSGLQFPDPDQRMRWLLPPRSDTMLFSLDVLAEGDAPHIGFNYKYLAGDPGASHRSAESYRVPFAIANDYAVSQAYPDVATHTTRDSAHAVDIAMPVGTDIFAARDGVVFDVASRHFRNGLDEERDGPAANVVRILHDDGTYAIYAHLNWNTIRVTPGQRVSRGQYIAESGNTGYSSGPHLHFAVVQNKGMRIESVPVVFQGADAKAVSVSTGMMLTAY